jgi:hypothetical protein
MSILIEDVKDVVDLICFSQESIESKQEEKHRTYKTDFKTGFQARIYSVSLEDLKDQASIATAKPSHAEASNEKEGWKSR